MEHMEGRTCRSPQGVRRRRRQLMLGALGLALVLLFLISPELASAVGGAGAVIAVILAMTDRDGTETERDL